eukprot:767705-Hanusia_phi.AAC.3
MSKSSTDGFNLGLDAQDENFDSLVKQWGGQQDVQEHVNGNENNQDRSSESFSRMSDEQNEPSEKDNENKRKTKGRRASVESELSSEHLWINELNASAISANLSTFDYCKLVKSKPEEHPLELWSLARRYINREIKKFRRFHVTSIDDVMMEAIELGRNSSYKKAHALQLMRMFERRNILQEEGLLVKGTGGSNSSEVWMNGWKAREAELLLMQKSSPTGFIREEASGKFNKTVLMEGGSAHECLLLDESEGFTSFDELPDDDEDDGKGMNKREKEWEARLLELGAFYKEHGHTNVPKRYMVNPQLGSWVIVQRSKIRKGLLGQDKKQRLEELNFEWELKKSKNATRKDLTRGPGGSIRVTAGAPARVRKTLVKSSKTGISAFLVKHNLDNDIGERLLHANVTTGEHFTWV